MNSIDQIRTYKKLLDEGVLNVDEFNKLKNETLSKTDTDQGDVFELLKGFKSLVDEGLITQDEFNIKKEFLLNRNAATFTEAKNPESNSSATVNLGRNDPEHVHPISNKPVTEARFDPQKLQSINGNKKVLIIGAVVAAIVLLVLIGGSSKLNADEQHVVNCIKSVSYETFTVSDAYVVHHEYSNGEKVTYAVITYSGTNSYGNAIAGTAVFKDGYYLMDFYDDIPNDGSFSSLDKAVAIRDIKLAPSNEKAKVKAKKINKALKKV